MAGRYLATELQDDNGDVIYPHTEADIVFTSDGTTVEENLNGEVTDTDMQEIFTGSQPETGKKLSVVAKVKNALKKYQALLGMKILDTVEEVEANTDDGYLMGAKAGAELINDLAFPDGTKFYPDKQNGKYGFNTSPTRGADTFNPFMDKVELNFLYGRATTINRVQTHFYGKFTPNHDTEYVIIGGRRCGGAFHATVLDSSGNTIATSTLLSADGDNDTISIGKVECHLEANKEYTFFIPADGITANNYYRSAFVVYP